MTIKNAKELNIITEIKGSEYFQLSRLCPTTTEEMMADAEEKLPEGLEEGAKTVPVNLCSNFELSLINPQIKLF
jgi:hypothetical protein